MNETHLKNLLKIVSNKTKCYVENFSGKHDVDIASFLINEREVNGIKSGKSKLALIPETTEQIAAILKYCNENNIPVFTQGGNTGLVGGSTPDETDNGIVLSTRNMQKIISDINNNSQTIKLEAGVVIDNLNEKLEKYGLFCSIKHGGTGSSNIGGNIATNSGGSNALKYGVTRDQVIGLTVVTPNGEILKLGGNLKDTTGITDLKQVFIGSEGSLGVITEAEIKLHKIPEVNQVILLGFDDIAVANKLLSSFKDEFGESSLEAFEYMDSNSYNLSINYTEGAKNLPIDRNLKNYLLIEISSQVFEGQDLQEKIVNFLEDFISKNVDFKIENIVLAFSETDKNLFWSIRENCSSASKSLSGGNGVWFDDCVPVENIAQSINLTEKAIKRNFSKQFELGNIKIINFGHMSDGNIHTHIIQPKETISKDFDINNHLAKIEDLRLGIVSELGGNPFAEHGVGIKQYKLKYIQKEQLEYMQKIKQVFDPNNILNPGRVLPQRKTK